MEEMTEREHIIGDLVRKADQDVQRALGLTLQLTDSAQESMLIAATVAAGLVSLLAKGCVMAQLKAEGRLNNDTPSREIQNNPCMDDALVYASMVVRRIALGRIASDANGPGGITVTDLSAAASEDFKRFTGRDFPLVDPLAPVPHRPRWKEEDGVVIKEAEEAVRTYSSWISSLVESQSTRNAKERAKKLADFQYAMSRLQVALKMNEKTS